MRRLSPILIILIALCSGCSGGGILSTPDAIPAGDAESGERNHYTWGLWQFVADPEAQTLDVIQLRQGSLHLNALPFLEPPPYQYLTLEGVEFEGNLLTAGIGLRHPFLGLTQFSGFDVAGVLITNGSVSGFSDPDLVMTGEGDTRLLNPDGYSRWWNPVEFPLNPGTIFGYTDGLLGAPDSLVDFNCTLNGYKYFTDDLDPGDPLSAVDISNRGLFSPGQKNVRTYEIEIGNAGFIFNYAVDASWKFPAGSPPWTAPDDFLPGANRAEPWRIETTETENTLWNDGVGSGGNLSLQVDVYDWFDAELNTVRVESPGNFTLVESAVTTGGGVGYSTYELDITGATPAPAEIDLLISVISEDEDFGGFIPGVNTTAYFTYTADVSGDTPVSFDIEWDDEIQLESIYPQYEEISPAVAQQTNGQLRVVWQGLRDTPGIQDHSARSSDGISWVTGAIFNSSGGTVTVDKAKVMTDLEGDSYMICARPYGHFLCDADRSIGGNSDYTYYTIPSEPDMEFGRTDDGYPVTWTNSSTDGPGIRFRRGPVPNRIGPTNGGFDWVHLPTIPVTEQGYVSHVRSWDLDSTGNLYLVYYDTVDNSIEISISNDDGDTWNSPVTIFTDAGYDNVKHPSLAVGDDDYVHVSFVRGNTSTNEYEMCYARSTDGGANWTTPVVLDTSTSEIEDDHVQRTDAFDLDVPIVCYQADGEIRVAWSTDGGQNFIEPVTISAYNPCIDSDMIVLTQTGTLPYDIIAVWAYLDGTDYDIHYKLGAFVSD